MQIDSALALVGGYRRWHISIFFLLSFSTFLPTCLISLAYVFIGIAPPHQCAQEEDDLYLNTTHGGSRILYAGDYDVRQCDIYMNRSQPESIPCPGGWDYNTTRPDERTVVMEWDLVCSRDFLVNLSQVMTEVGGLLAHLIGSSLADVYGRKKIFILCNFLVAITGIISAVAPNYTVFVIARTASGFVIMVALYSGFVLLLELYDQRHKMTVGFGCDFLWVAAYFMLPLLAYFIRNWRYLLLAGSIIQFIWIIFIWFLPESPLWLVSNGRYSEAADVVLFMGRMNGLKIDKNIKITHECYDTDTELVELQVNHDKGDEEEGDEVKSDAVLTAYSWTVLFTDRILLKHLLVGSWIWFVNNIVYYGLVLNTPSLGGNIYVNYVIGGVMELIGYAIAYLVSLKFGRKPPTVGLHLGAGVSLICLVIVPGRSSLRPLVITFAMLGKLFISASYAVIVIYLTEIFPTSVRSRSVGLSNVPGRLGSILAPMVLYMARRAAWVPNLIFGVLALTASLLTFTLPETSDKPLPNTIEAVRDLYKPRGVKQEKAEEHKNIKYQPTSA